MESDPHVHNKYARVWSFVYVDLSQECSWLSILICETLALESQLLFHHLPLNWVQLMPQSLKVTCMLDCRTCCSVTTLEESVVSHKLSHSLHDCMVVLQACNLSSYYSTTIYTQA